MYSFLSHTTTAPPLSAGFMTMSSLFCRLIRAADSSGVRLDFFRWYEFEVSYLSQTLVDVALTLGVGTVRRFFVDRSAKRSCKNVIIGITLTFRMMTKDCHPSQRTEETLTVMDDGVLVD